jgi:ribosomal protein S12 methylthiotransferase
VVTGCLAERYGKELADALPEVDLVAGFGVPLVPVSLGATKAGGDRHGASFDLLELPRPAHAAPWAYVKVAEGCDRRCGFCAIPSFRGPQRSRSLDTVLAEVEALGPSVREVVLVAQDLASWGLDRTGERCWARGREPRPVVDLVRRVSDMVERVRLLYLYPSSLDDRVVQAIVDSGVPYFDLSLQHASRPHLRRMRRWGDAQRFLDRIAAIRAAAPDAALRSSFILGYPGETEDDHDVLLAFIAEARLDWGGFFPFSEEPGTLAAGPKAGPRVPAELAMERLRECAELQDAITAERRGALVGSVIDVLVDEPGHGRSFREAPEIDGTVHVDGGLASGTICPMRVTEACGPDVWAEPVP